MTGYRSAGGRRLVHKNAPGGLVLVPGPDRAGGVDTLDPLVHYPVSGCPVRHRTAAGVLEEEGVLHLPEDGLPLLPVRLARLLGIGLLPPVRGSVPGVPCPCPCRHPDPPQYGIGRCDEMTATLGRHHPVALGIALEPGGAVYEPDGCLYTYLLQLLLVEHSLVGKLHRLPALHVVLEAIGIARLGQESFGFGYVVGVLLAVELSPAGQLGYLLRRPAKPGPHAQRRGEAIQPLHPEGVEEGLAVQGKVDGLSHLWIIEGRYAGIHEEEKEDGITDILYPQLVVRFLLELDRFLVAQ